MSDGLEQIEMQKPERKKPGPKPGHRDNQRVLGEQKVIDRFDMSNVRRDESRVAMSATMSLGGVKKEDGWHYRWTQDKDNRIEQVMEAGYEVVRDGNGKPVVRKKGKFPMYLMRLPQNLRQRDLDNKAQEVNNTLIDKNKLAKDDYIPGVQDGTRSHVIERDRSQDFDPLN